MGLILAIAWVLLLPAIASASVVINNNMQGEVAGVSSGPQIYGYRQGAAVTFDTDVDFNAGTLVDVEVDGTGTQLQLAGAPSVAWWDATWGARRCFSIDNPGGALDSYQVRVAFDSSSDLADGLVTNGDDYRALADDDATELPLWLESGVGTTETVVWVQLDLAAATQTRFCLYFDNPAAASVSDQGLVFSYDTPQQLYFPAYYRFDGGGGNNGSLNLVSFVDGNDVTVDGANFIMAAGEVRTFTNITEDSVILSTGPLAGRGLGDGMDSIAPVSFAGTDMVFPTNRGTQRWSLVSPTGATATVEIYDGTTLRWSGNVGATVVSPTADVGNNRSGVIRSTNGVPIIATHTSTQRYDSLVVPPYFGDDIFGVRSRGTWVGVAGGPASVEIWRSDGTIDNLTNLPAGSVADIYDSADLDGNGTAVRFTNMTSETGGLQQADRNGLESTSYLPQRLLESEYYLPTRSDYIAFACPVTTTINIGATQVPCNSIGAGFPGHGITGEHPAGTRIWSDNGEPFFAYYEDDATQDETNLFGMKSAQAYSDVTVNVVPEPREQLPEAPTSGTWTSPAVDTTAGDTNVFGLLTVLGDAPAGTEVRVQVARGATPALVAVAPFVGPDGSGSTWFDLGQNATPFDWDFGDQYVAFQIALSATTPGDSPSVDAISLGYDLPELGQSSMHLIDSAPVNGVDADRDWVLRVWTEDPILAGSEASGIYLQAAGTTVASVMTLDVGPEQQIEINGTSVLQTTGLPIAAGPGLAHNVTVESQNMIGADVTAIWQDRLAGSGVLVHHRLQLAFV